MASSVLATVLVAAYRALCSITLHRWVYHPNEHGGKPMLRSCVHCGKRQTWNYRLARERGVIQWEDAAGVTASSGETLSPSDADGQPLEPSDALRASSTVKETK